MNADDARRLRAPFNWRTAYQFTPAPNAKAKPAQKGRKLSNGSKVKKHQGGAA
jgi:hypothetical protein